MIKSVKAVVFSYIAEFFSIPSSEISNATVAEDIAGWDSLANAEIVLGLEEVFAIELEPDELVKLDDVGCLIAAIESRVGN